MRIYNQEHREEANERTRNRRIVDINFKLGANLRNRVKLALNGNPKLSTTMNLVGCSIDELKHYLSSKFTEGMTWDNHGLYGWHVDHIIPCISFDLRKKSEQRKCFHYTNLQPLWAKENLIKGGKI